MSYRMAPVIEIIEADLACSDHQREVVALTAAEQSGSLGKDQSE